MANKIVFCGTHVGGRLAFESLLQAGYQIDAVVCITPEKAEQLKVSGYLDYAPLAEAHGIPLYRPEKYSLKGESDTAFFEENQFDLLIQGGWQRLFPEPVLSTLKIGAIGLHGSPDLLPKGRGRSPLNWSLIEGRKRFLMHLFLMKVGVDDGDVFAFTSFDINDFDDIETLYYKYSISYRNLLIEQLPSLLDGSFQSIPQVGEPSYFAKRSAEDGEIDWEQQDVHEIYNAVRAQTRPYPGAFAQMNDGLYTIWRCRVFDTRFLYPEAKYGEVVERFGEKLIVRCRGGLLLVDECEPRTR